MHMDTTQLIIVSCCKMVLKTLRIISYLLSTSKRMFIITCHYFSLRLEALIAPLFTAWSRFD